MLSWKKGRPLHILQKTTKPDNPAAAVRYWLGFVTMKDKFTAVEQKKMLKVVFKVKSSTH